MGVFSFFLLFSLLNFLSSPHSQKHLAQSMRSAAGTGACFVRPPHGFRFPTKRSTVLKIRQLFRDNHVFLAGKAVDVARCRADVARCRAHVAAPGSAASDRVEWLHRGRAGAIQTGRGAVICGSGSEWGIVRRDLLNAFEPKTYKGPCPHQLLCEPGRLPCVNRPLAHQLQAVILLRAGCELHLQNNESAQ